MVASLAALATSLPASAAGPLAAAAAKTEPLLNRLDPPQRTKVLMTLLGLVLLGLLLIAIAYLGGRHVIRLARKRSGPTPTHDDRWYRKPLVPPEPASPEPREPE
jgi:hypothetical protein